VTPPARDARLDAIRGWMQISIFISHIAGSLGAMWVIHAAWGFSDSSEQFVFLSGFGLGSVFLWKQARLGFVAACRDLGMRFARLWRMHMLVFLGFGLMVALAAEWFDVKPWAFALAHPWWALLGGAVLLYQPPFMGIFPIFLMAMAMLPLFSWLAARHGAQALWLPALLYVASQLLPADWPGLFGTTLAFSPPAWIALFLLGAFFGRRVLTEGRAIGRHPLLVAGALAVVAAGATLKINGVLPGWLVGKEQLAPLRLLHALACAYLVVALIPRDAGWAQSVPARALAVIGRNSLPVFALGLFLSWLASLALHEAPGAQPWSEPLLLLTGVGALYLFARRLERRTVRAAALRARA
jgi:hypothetical protein